MAMSLCNIQFHRNAEHKTGEFADYAGNGNGEAYQPGPTLGACLSDATMNPHLRVEAQVFVQVNDQKAGNFVELARHDVSNGLPQLMNIPTDTGSPIVYADSTTDPAYNEKASALQVTWSVRPKVAKVDIATVGEWCRATPLVKAMPTAFVTLSLIRICCLRSSPGEHSSPRQHCRRHLNLALNHGCAVCCIDAALMPTMPGNNHRLKNQSDQRATCRCPAGADVATVSNHDLA